jgi:mRNA interferase MazF
MARSGVPEAGDIVWLAFSPHAGHEQAGRRPALVLSPGSYNGKTSMMVCCPLTSQVKGYPFEVVITRDPPSAVLADQIKSLDWRARGAVRKGRAPDAVLETVRGKIRALIGA